MVLFFVCSLQAIRLFTVSTVNAAQSGQAAAENLPPEVWAEVEAIEGLLKRRIPIGMIGIRYNISKYFFFI
jgi:hypothetical protein